jgi:hypothetical protein
LTIANGRQQDQSCAFRRLCGSATYNIILATSACGKYKYRYSPIPKKDFTAMSEQILNLTLFQKIFMKNPRQVNN